MRCRVSGNRATISSCARWMRKRFVFLALVPVLLAFVLLRVRWVGHVLVWDEALNVCSFRALASQSTDPYSNWFWCHPPLFYLFTLLLSPTAPGFAARIQILSIALGCVSCLFLYVLNKRVFGTATAWWSVFFLAVMPGAVFFDVWVKRDMAVTVFGLLSLVLWALRRYLLSGLALGLAFLSKETALFYAFAIGGISLLEGKRMRWRPLLTVAGMAVLVSAWWFVGFSSTVKYFTSFFSGSKEILDSVWYEPWHFYFGRLPSDLGVPGLVFGAVGMLTGLIAFYAIVRCRREKRSPAALWPLTFLVPSYLLLCLSRGKLAWISAGLFPAWATLEAVGVMTVARFLKRHPGVWRARAGLDVRRRVFLTGVYGCGVLLAAWLFCAAYERVDYEDVLHRMHPGFCWAARASREAAEALNLAAKPGERALVTSLYYWRNSYIPHVPDAAFAYYLDDIPVVIRSHDASSETLVAAIREYRLDWALLSPVPCRTGQPEVIRYLMDTYDLRPRVLTGARLFRTTSIYESDVHPNSTDEP